MNSDYALLTKESRSLGETNDCVIKALAVVTATDYTTVSFYTDMRGRKKGKGMDRKDYLKILTDFGFSCRRFSKDELTFICGQGKSLKKVEARLQRCYQGSRLLIMTSRHVSGFDGECIQDWAAGGLKRVQAIYEVIEQ